MTNILNFNKSTISPTIRVSIGDVHFPFLTLMKRDNHYFVVLHEKGALPNIKTIKESKSLKNKCILVEKELHDVIKEGIYENERIGGYHLNPPSFLVGYCLANKHDLYKLNIFEL